MTFDHTNTVFHYTNFYCQTDTYTLKKGVTTWPLFLERLKVFDDRTEKDGPNWAPCHYSSKTRSDRTVELLSALVFDIDDMKTEDLEAALERIDVEAYAHSSFSDSAEQRKIRIVMPFKEPITFEDLSNTRDYIAAKYGIQYDPKTKNRSRIFFFPSGQYRWSRHFPGPLLEVYKPNPRLAPLLKPLRREKPDVQRLAENIVYGFPIAQRGSRDDSMHKAAWMMIKNIPDLTEDEAVELIKPSLQKMETDSSFEDEVEKFRVKYQAADRHPELKVRATVVAQSHAQHTPEQLAQWAKEQGTTVEGFKKRWVIERGGVYNIFDATRGVYLTGIQQRSLKIALPQYLASSGLPLTYTSAKGKEVDYDVDALLKRYSTTALRGVVSLVAKKSTYDEATLTFTEAAAPLAPRTPTHHEDVHQWLIALGCDQADKLIDWLACVTLLDRQCAALFIEGDAGSGKTLLAGSIAKLWGKDTTPTDFNNLVSDFNDAILNCPLVTADEGFLGSKSRNINNDLRKWTAPQGLSINRKFMPEMSLVGNIRLLITANNNKALGTFGSMNHEDRAALAERIVHVSVRGGKAREFMESRSLDEKKLLAETKIPEHLLWLRDNIKVTPGNRFIVQGSGEFITNLITVQTSYVSAMYGFIVDVLTSIKSEEARKSYSNLLVFGGGRLLVSSKLFKKADWEEHCQGIDVPTMQDINNTLETLKKGERVQLGRVYFYDLDLDLLETWAKEQNAYEWADVRKRIEEKQ